MTIQIRPPENLILSLAMSTIAVKKKKMFSRWRIAISTNFENEYLQMHTVKICSHVLYDSCIYEDNLMILYDSRKLQIVPWPTNIIVWHHNEFSSLWSSGTSKTIASFDIA